MAGACEVSSEPGRGGAAPGNDADLGFASVVRDTHALLLCAVHLPSVANVDLVQIASGNAK